MLTYLKGNGMKMKKIICLLVFVSCALSLFACGGSGKGAEAIVEMVNSSAPDKITTKTYYTYDGDTLEGSYVTTMNGQEFTFDYEYQDYADPAVDGGSDYIVTRTGVIYYKDGKYSTDGEEWFTEIPDAAYSNMTLNIELKKIGKYTVSRDGTSITTVVSAKQAEDILGITLSAVTEDGVQIIIKTNGTKFVGLEVSYETMVGEENTASVVIDTSYEYIPKEPAADAPAEDAETPAE